MSRHHIKIWSKSLIWILAVTAFPAYSFIHYQIENSNGISIDDFFKSDEKSSKKVDETKAIKKTIPGDSTKKTIKSDTGKLKYPIKQNDDRNKSDYDNNIDLLDPSVKTYFEYNSKTGMYDEYKEQAGKKTLLRSLSKDDYMEESEKKERKEYFDQRAKSNAGSSGYNTNKKIDLIKTPPILDKVFRGGLIDIQPSGSAELTFGGIFNTVRNPQFTARQQKTRQFDFDQKIQLNVTGKIGNALNLGIKYDTDATFDFDNQTKLDWVGKEDQMLRKVELGNVSLPLNGSLIQAGQSLFGIKTQWQFGKLGMTIIATQNKGQRTETSVNGGAQITNFNIQAHNYDQNRHFFLAQFFKDRFEIANQNLPALDLSAVINRVEVWVTNRSGSYENTRDLLTCMDLGETRPYNKSLVLPGQEYIANNETNALYNYLLGDDKFRNANTTINQLTNNPNLKQGTDYELLTYAKQLTENEFTVNKQLGYISLNTALNNDEVLAVAFEYTYNGRTYKVGEFASEVASNRDESKVLFVKMLKGNIIRTRLPIWQLMMKNIYSLGSYNINTSDFNFNVIYNDDPSGADLNYLPVKGFPQLSDGIPLLRVMNLDNLNRQEERKPDGTFDMLEGRTFQGQQGRIIFPVLEPFGNYLRSKFNNDSFTANKYVFDALYDSTKWLAEQDVTHNKFFLKGSYKGNSSAEISLNALNVPQGSVIVTANGTKLTENVDYTVDYNAGKVTIINQGILQSGATIKVSAESNSMFNVQQKTLLGARFDYTANRKTMLGGTILHMYERALTPKTNIGDEPLLNTIIGIDGSYNSNSLFLTKLVDKLPFIETKAESKVTAQGEFAKLFPGKARGQNKTRGVSYIDDFEGAETTFDLRLISNWKLSSLPQFQKQLFPEWEEFNQEKKPWGYYRSKLAWYNIDPTFYRDDKYTPDHIKNDVNMQSNHYMREVLVTEVFPNKQLQQGAPTILPTLDMAFFPNERGMYNYNFNANDFNPDGTFKQPVKTWGGIMRRIETNDFEAANIDYIEVWLMDPFIYNKNNKGQLYINLGNVSEDILPDRRKSFENGSSPKGELKDMDSSSFGYVSNLPQLNNAFDNEPDARPYQDLGLDGLNDDQERYFRDSFLNQLKLNFGASSDIYLKALNDPSNDNYKHNRHPDYNTALASIIDRYKAFNSHQGNSTLNKLSDGTPESAVNTPDNEDINNDFTMNQTEDYFQYKIDLSPQDLQIGNGYCTDINEVDKLLKNGKTERIKWYQLKIPIKQFTSSVGNISDFKSIRFMRMFLKGFDSSVVLRFGQLQLVRADWRRYLQTLNSPGAIVPLDPTDNTKFTVSTVNIEENGKRSPIRYVVPPGISRVQDPTSQNVVQQNEQSLSLAICNLKPGDSRAAYKTTNFDIRNYKKMQMFVHAEGTDVKDGELSAFIRIGTDLVNNYYEYEIPLNITPNGTYNADGIWKKENEFDFDLSDLFDSKELRSKSNVPLNRPFWYFKNNGHKISILGLPDLSNIRVVMLGIRNNADVAKCGEVWFNELRVSDITNKSGWATTGRVVAQMADFATLSASGNISTIGFGGVDKRLNERNLSDNYQFDLSSSFELGKFFPQKAGVNIPMFIGYSGTISRPKFNPLNPDVELDKALNSLSGNERDALKKAAEDYNSRYSINFTNVRKNRTGSGKLMPWSLSNFNLTYSYIMVKKRNIQIEDQFSKTYHGSVGYNYSPTVKPWEPFKFIKNRKLAIIKDINFYKMPQNITVRFDADRYYSETQNRNNDLFKQFTPRLFDKNFTMNRFYVVNYPITKSLKLDYTATAIARIEEPFGQLNTEEKRDTVRDEFFSLGRMRDFNQQANFNYTLPFSKIGFLNWISSDVKYSSNYQWKQAPPALPGQGNTIQNSREINVNTQLNLVNLYNKIPFLRKINQGGSTKKSNTKIEKKKTEGAGDAGAKSDEADPKKKKEKQKFGTNFLRALMMLRNASITYTQREGTLLPGFIYQIDYFGQNFAHNAPGLPFILGSQSDDTRYIMAKNGSLSNDPSLGNYFLKNYTQTIQGNATVEPFKDFKIQLNFNLNKSTNLSSIFKYDTAKNYNDWRDFQTTETGNFSMSHIFIRTAFEKVSSDNDWVSQNYENFEQFRYVVAQRQQNSDGRVSNKSSIDSISKYPSGYGPTAQNTLLPAFLAAYTGQNQSKVGLSPILKIPLPNWNINYNGLTKIKSIAKKFSNITIQHRYQGVYTIGGFTSNLYYDPDTTPVKGKDLVSKYNINNVTIREQFSPLLGVDFTTKGGVTGGFKMNRSRNVTLLVPNANVIENTMKEWSFRLGYRTSGVKLPLNFNGKRVYLANDLQMDLDISVQNNFTVKRVVDQNTNTPTGGQRVVLIRPNINYMISNNLNLNIFYDRRASKPAISNSFPTALTTFGFKLRYTLQ